MPTQIYFEWSWLGLHTTHRIPQPRNCACALHRLKKLPSKVLDDVDDDDDLSTDGGSLCEAPLSFAFPRDSTMISQI